MKNENSTYSRVKKLLIENPELRDSDRKLIAEIWKMETPGIWTKKGFLKAMSEGKLSKSSTIRRARQQIQAKHEFLKPHRP